MAPVDVKKVPGSSPSLSLPAPDLPPDLTVSDRAWFQCSMLNMFGSPVALPLFYYYYFFLPELFSELRGQEELAK